MKNKSTLSIRELTENIRDCQSLKEMECVIWNIRTEFDRFSISDQAFLLALIGVTLMNLTATVSPASSYSSKMHLTQLLSVVKWKE